MAEITAVHGIGQSQLGRGQIQSAWSIALGDGLEFAAGRRVPVPLDVAFYGDLFNPRIEGPEPVPDKAGGTDERDWEVWLAEAASAEEIDALLEAAQDVVTPQDAEAAEAAPSKAYTRLPRAVQRLLGAVDHRYGPGRAMLFVGAFREVRSYLCDPGVKRAVDERVDAGVPPECTVLVGHSLGSVVAFEYLRRNGQRRFDLLLTLGSPLALRMVRSLMPNPSYGAVRGRPAGARRWVNVYDVHDPVTGGRGLESRWPGVVDEPVDNGGDAHSAIRYLTKKQSGRAVLAALPGPGR